MKPEFYSKESGQMIVLITVLLVGLIGIMAVAVDGGGLYYERRTAQNAADNAALAGAWAICDDDSNPSSVALDSANDNGFDNDGNTNTVTASHPPTLGAYAGNNQYIEVSIVSTITSNFSSLVYAGPLETTARAVARCRNAFDYAVIALTTENDVRGIQVVGSGDLIVNGGGVISNSAHPTQALYENGAGVLYADPIHVNGGVYGDGFSQAPVTGIEPVLDPLADVPPPPLPPGPCIDANYSGAQTITLDPGLYCQITGDSNVDFNLNPGIYYIEGPGSFTVTAESTIVGSEVMIYLAPTAGPVLMQGNALVDLSAPTSGIYEGMLFYADRNYTNNVTMIGNSTWDAVGTLYAASANLDLSGNGDVNNLSSLVVAWTVKLGGDSDVVVNYDPGSNYRPPLTVSLIE